MEDGDEIADVRGDDERRVVQVRTRVEGAESVHKERDEDKDVRPETREHQGLLVVQQRVIKSDAGHIRGHEQKDRGRLGRFHRRVQHKCAYTAQA